MAFPRLDIVDADNTSTVLWSLNDQTGAVNVNGVQSKLGPVRFGNAPEITTVGFESRDGGQVVRRREGLWPADAIIYPKGSTPDVTATSLGLLARLLSSGGVMAWQRTSTSAERFIYFEPSPTFTLFQGQQIPDLASIAEGTRLEWLMQPFLAAAATSTTPTAVPNDPASAGGRLLSVTIGGDLPTPVAVKSQMNTGAAVSSVVVAHKTATAAHIIDLVDETAWAQLEASGRGWTRTAGTDETTANDGIEASPASATNVSRTTYATNALMARRVRLTRTTKLDSLRGQWDVYLRCKTTAASRHLIQLRWSPSTSEVMRFIGDPVEHDTYLGGGGITTFGYVEKLLGSFYLPEDTSVALSGLALEVWSERTAGTGSLDKDHLFFVPKQTRAVIAAPTDGTSDYFFANTFTTPVTNPAGGTAGTVDQASLILDTLTDNAGVAPAGGTVLAAGRYRSTFELTGAPSFSGTVVVRVRNITDSTTLASKTVTIGASQFLQETLDWDAASGKAYEEQVDDPSILGILIRGIRRQPLTTLGANEYFRSDPGVRYSVDRLDSTASLAGSLSVQGTIPAVLSPGPVLIFTFAEDAALPQYQEPQSIRTRQQTVTLTSAERYAL